MTMIEGPQSLGWSNCRCTSAEGIRNYGAANGDSAHLLQLTSDSPQAET